MLTSITTKGVGVNPAFPGLKGSIKVVGSNGSSFQSSSSVIAFDADVAVGGGGGSQSRHVSSSIFTPADRLDIAIVLSAKEGAIGRDSICLTALLE